MRLPVSILLESVLSEIHTVQSVHYPFWLPVLLLLQHEIEKSLPSAGGNGGLAGNPVVKELKKMMEEVEAIKAEREVIENELKEAKFDMGIVFVYTPLSSGDYKSLQVC